MELYDYELVWCTRKILFLKLNEHDKISVRSMKNYLHEIFVEQLRPISWLPELYLVNDAHQDFITLFCFINKFSWTN